MANQLFNQLQGPARGSAQSFGNMVERFQNFKRNFNGDPYTIVQQMLNDGRMSQSQFNQLRQMADEFQKTMRNFKF